MMVTAEQVRALLDYDPATGVFRWRQDVAKHIKAGYVAGTVQPNGYRIIRIERRGYSAHRLAWLHVHGAWPSKALDHVDAQRDHNAISNLREATAQENKRNCKKPATNKSGFKGVCWDIHKRKWRAQIRGDTKMIFLGYFADAADAHAAYCNAAAVVHLEFARTE